MSNSCSECPKTYILIYISPYFGEKYFFSNGGHWGHRGQHLEVINGGQGCIQEWHRPIGGLGNINNHKK